MGALLQKHRQWNLLCCFPIYAYWSQGFIQHKGCDFIVFRFGYWLGSSYLDLDYLIWHPGEEEVRGNTESSFYFLGKRSEGDVAHANRLTHVPAPPHLCHNSQCKQGEMRMLFRSFQAGAGDLGDEMRRRDESRTYQLGRQSSTEEWARATATVPHLSLELVVGIWDWDWDYVGERQEGYVT
jgi:hypothetical protein